MTPIDLYAGALRIVVLPELGGGIARFDVLRAGEPQPLFRPWDGESTDPNSLGCYVLLPWSNRISGGGIDAGGSFWPLAANAPGEPFPLHGSGWQKPWEVAGQTSTGVRLSLHSAEQPPFDFRAELAYELDDSSLVVSLDVEHLGKIPVPYGLGLHPWLPRTPRTTVEASSSEVWLETRDHLPDRLVPVRLRPEWDFGVAKRLPAAWINNGFTGWNGHARVRWPENGLGLDIEASELLDTCIIYAPDADAGFFCIEPVSHAVDAHHLPGGPEAHGLVILEPGARLAATCRFTAITRE